MNHNHSLRFKYLGIDSQEENVVFLKENSPVCLSEGFEALTRLIVQYNGFSLIATLNIIRTNLLDDGEVSLSENAAAKLGIREGEKLSFSHLDPITSLSYVRAKMYGERLSDDALEAIIRDVTEGQYSKIHLSAFITACAGDKMNIQEIVGLTKAMVHYGAKMDWGSGYIVDKHCVGGLPGNRTTPIVVAIMAAAGFKIPKTSSRAITSPAGTADVMDVITNVDLSLDKIYDVVEANGGSLAWGGAVQLSPADDKLIKVEKAMDIDSEAQMIASVISKKAAAGSSVVVIDMPVGPTAKIRSYEDAEKLKYYFMVVAWALGLEASVMITDGNQPVGIGIGPALEAKDVLAVLENSHDAAVDLKERALAIAGNLFELAQVAEKGEGVQKAKTILETGQAFEHFKAICEAQGGFEKPGQAAYTYDIIATQEGTVQAVDNRKLANVAKLTGAPNDKNAGLEFFAKLGSQFRKGDTLYRIHAETEGEMHYALRYAEKQTDVIKLG